MCLVTGCIHSLVYAPKEWKMKFPCCVYRPRGAWDGETVLQNSAEGGSLQATVTHKISWGRKEKLPRLAMTKVNADTRKSRQPLSPKIKSRRASLVLNKT